MGHVLSPLEGRILGWGKEKMNDLSSRGKQPKVMKGKTEWVIRGCYNRGEFLTAKMTMNNNIFFSNKYIHKK